MVNRRHSLFEKTILTALLSFLVLVVFSSAAAAQSSPPYYINKEHRFAVIFPGQPMARDIAYATHSGMSVLARQFYIEQAGEQFLMTVVHFAAGATIDNQAVDHAADQLRRKGEVRFQFAEEYDPGIPGRQLNIFEPNGRQLRASVYMADRYLTITEANATPGDFNALQFEQSITLVDSMGVDRERNQGQDNRRFDCPR